MIDSQEHSRPGQAPRPPPGQCHGGHVGHVGHGHGVHMLGSLHNC